MFSNLFFFLKGTCKYNWNLPRLRVFFMPVMMFAMLSVPRWRLWRRFNIGVNIRRLVDAESWRSAVGFAHCRLLNGLLLWCTGCSRMCRNLLFPFLNLTPLLLWVDKFIRRTLAASPPLRFLNFHMNLERVLVPRPFSLWLPYFQ